MNSASGRSGKKNEDAMNGWNIVRNSVAARSGGTPAGS
jgi:hypothetical protein